MSGANPVPIESTSVVLCVLPDAQWTNLRVDWAARAPRVRFEHVSSGEEGLERLGALRPAVVVVSMNVEDMEGLEFLACTMARYKDYRGKVIVYPGDGDPFSPVAHFRDAASGRSVTEEIEPSSVTDLIAALAPPMSPTPATAPAAAAAPAQVLPALVAEAPAATPAPPTPAKAPASPPAPIRPSPIRALVLGPKPAPAVSAPPVPSRVVAPPGPPPPPPLPSAVAAPAPAPAIAASAAVAAPAVAAPSVEMAVLAPALAAPAVAAPAVTKPAVSGMDATMLALPTAAVPLPGTAVGASPSPLPESGSMFTAALDAPSGAPWNTQATAPSMIRPARKPPFIALGAGAALLIAVLVISARHCTGNASTSAATSSAAVQPHAAPPTASPDPAAQATSVANARAPAAPSPSVPPPASDSASFDPKALTTLPLSFQRGRADFAVEDAAAFDSIIKSLARNLEDNPTARLEIGGHTSSEGAPSVNRALGRERALLVQTYLVEHAISRERTTIVNYSASKPVASTTNAEANRRVTLRILH